MGIWGYRMCARVLTHSHISISLWNVGLNIESPLITAPKNLLKSTYSCHDVFGIVVPLGSNNGLFPWLVVDLPLLKNMKDLGFLFQMKNKKCSKPSHLKIFINQINLTRPGWDLTWCFLFTLGTILSFSSCLPRRSSFISGISKASLWDRWVCWGLQSTKLWLLGGAMCPSWKMMGFVNGFRMTSHILYGK